MKSIKNTTLFSLLVFCFTISTTLGQSVKQEKMKQLNYLVGEWIGTSSQYENGKLTKEVPAFEKISYDLDSNILVVELNTELLQLHTIIYYDDKEDTYYYHPFSKWGMKIRPATFDDGKLVVHASETVRYTFAPTDEGGFQEYGEKLIDGEWQLYFNDVFIDSR